MKIAFMTSRLSRKQSLGTSYGRLEVPKLSSWTQMKNLVKHQTKLMRIAWSVGIGSTLVVTAYTLQAITIQSQQRIINELDIQIKTIQLENLRNKSSKGS